jgi:hypothetical protein
VDPTKLNDYARERIEKCRECTPRVDDDELVFVTCGWHENLAAGSVVVERLLGGDDA